jgi:hypothetical protein
MVNSDFWLVKSLKPSLKPSLKSLKSSISSDEIFQKNCFFSPVLAAFPLLFRKLAQCFGRCLGRLSNQRKSPNEMELSMGKDIWENHHF